jgi:hypothetical protein
MFILRCAALFALCVLAPGATPGDEPKKAVSSRL